MSSEPAPARPPEARLVAKKGQKSVLGLYLGNMDLMVSLNAKLKACGRAVGGGGGVGGGAQSWRPGGVRVLWGGGARERHATTLLLLLLLPLLLLLLLLPPRCRLPPDAPVRRFGGQARPRARITTHPPQPTPTTRAPGWGSSG